jgi:hypothetical protein
MMQLNYMGWIWHWVDGCMVVYRLAKTTYDLAVIIVGACFGEKTDAEN